MARPIRFSYEGAVFHITSRGNEKKEIFKTDEDRKYFLTVLERTIDRYGWLLHGYCLMNNHYHLLVEVPKGNISDGMRQLNGVYTQYFNRRHNRVGHLFQGRFKGIIVQKDEHLLELSRYIVLNPMRGKISKSPQGYRWSSYRAMIGKEKKTDYLFTDWILSLFGDIRKDATDRYREFVETKESKSPWEELKGQVYFGSDEFIKGVSKGKEKLKEIPRFQKMPIRPELSEIVKKREDILKAHKEYGYKLKEIAEHLKIHYTTAGRYLKQIEEGLLNRKT